jgi:hypothetical protein
MMHVGLVPTHQLADPIHGHPTFRELLQDKATLGRQVFVTCFKHCH